MCVAQKQCDRRANMACWNPVLTHLVYHDSRRGHCRAGPRLVGSWAGLLLHHIQLVPYNAHEVGRAPYEGPQQPG